MTNHAIDAPSRPDRSVAMLLSAVVALLLPIIAGVWPAQAQPASSNRILVMGDSLSAGYGMAASQGWVALLDRRLRTQHRGWRAVNASISGDTTAGGASRIVNALRQHRPQVVVIELGANDALRGLPLAQTRRNLAYMIGAAHGAGAQVLLIGMQMPPNLGMHYTSEFAQGYADLSARFGTALLPFLLQPIAADRSLFQDDNLHPTPAAQPAIRDHVWPALQPLLQHSATRQ